jgi:hypothetical protein
MLFHGSTFPTVIARLEPRHANDAAKPSGNQTAVYATADASTALAHAILNRNYLTRRLTSYVFGQTTLLGMTIFRATTNLHQLFVAGDDNLYTDGYVYVLTKGHFSRAADRPTEFHSLTAEAPIAALKVSRTLSEVLFVVRQDATRDTVLEYPAHEIPRLAAHARQMQARGPQH